MAVDTCWPSSCSADMAALNPMSVAASCARRDSACASWARTCAGVSGTSWSLDGAVGSVTDAGWSPELDFVLDSVRVVLGDGGGLDWLRELVLLVELALGV